MSETPVIPSQALSSLGHPFQFIQSLGWRMTPAGSADRSHHLPEIQRNSPPSLDLEQLAVEKQNTGRDSADLPYQGMPTFLPLRILP